MFKSATHKFWFAQTAARCGAGRVLDLLQNCLRLYKVVYLGPQRVVRPAGELIDQELEYQGRIAGPGVDIL